MGWKLYNFDFDVFLTPFTSLLAEVSHDKARICLVVRDLCSREPLHLVLLQLFYRPSPCYSFPCNPNVHSQQMASLDGCVWGQWTLWNRQVYLLLSLCSKATFSLFESVDVGIASVNKCKWLFYCYFLFLSRVYPVHTTKTCRLGCFLLLLFLSVWDHFFRWLIWTEDEILIVTKGVFNSR